MLFKEQIEEMAAHYQYLLNCYDNVLEKSPDGCLGYQLSHGREQFFYIHTENGKRKRECIDKDDDLVRLLARKKFAQQSKKVLEYDIEQLMQCVKRTRVFDPDEILGSMKSAYAKIPEEFFFDHDILTVNLNLDGVVQAKINCHRKWGNQPYDQSDFRIEDKRITTSRGLKVRSKSEALIVETMYRLYDVPNHYEQVQKIDGITICPDFTFEGADGELFYWEHMGMMDNDDYAEHNFEKLEKYHSIGIVPGDNLILSFDRHGTIDLQYIEGIIKNEVIPRL